MTAAMHDVIVVGGGLSGLATAYLLRKAGRDVVVLEEADVPGGKVRTIQQDGHRMECGPHAFMGSSDSLWKLVDDLGLEAAVERAHPAARSRYVVRAGRVLPLPMGLGSFVTTPLLSAAGKIRLALEPLVRRGGSPGESAWEFFVRRFGVEAATYIMSPFVSGVYAGDARILGARAAFPKFCEFEQGSGSMILGAARYMAAKRRRQRREGVTPRRGLYSLAGGIGRITETLAERLSTGLLLNTGAREIRRTVEGWSVSTATGDRRARSVVLAVPPDVAARVARALDADLSGSLDAIPMAPVAVAHWAAPLETHPAPGFGFLVPRHLGWRVLGTLFPSELFTGRAPAGQHLFASFYGGMTDPDRAGASEVELEALVRAEHQRLLGIDPESIRILAILRYPRAIPQLLPGHPEIVAKANERLGGLPGLFLAGNYLSGVGVEHAASSAYTASSACGAYLDRVRGS